MKITLEQWKAIEKAKFDARRAVEQLESVLISTMTDQERPEAEVLISLLELAENAGFELSRIDVHPQSEWMGGDSSDPKNFKVREPNCVPMPRGYLS